MRSMWVKNFFFFVAFKVGQTFLPRQLGSWSRFHNDALRNDVVGGSPLIEPLKSPSPLASSPHLHKAIKCQIYFHFISINIIIV